MVGEWVSRYVGMWVCGYVGGWLVVVSHPSPHDHVIDLFCSLYRGGHLQAFGFGY